MTIGSLRSNGYDRVTVTDELNDYEFEVSTDRFLVSSLSSGEREYGIALSLRVTKVADYYVFQASYDTRRRVKGAVEWENTGILVPSLTAKAKYLTGIDDILRDLKRELAIRKGEKSGPMTYTGCEYCKACRTVGEKEEREFRQYAASVMPHPSLRPHPDGQGFALIIGVNDDNFSRSSGLSLPEEEAKELRSILEKNGYAVKLLLDEEATRASVIGWIELICRMSRTPDWFLFYYAGHGVRLGNVRESLSDEMVYGYLQYDSRDALTADNEKNDDLYFLCYQDTVEERGDRQLVTSLVGNIEILSLLGNSRFSTCIEMINACYASSAVITAPATCATYDRTLSGRGLVYFSLIKEKVTEGEFSPIVYAGLSGKADGNGDSVVTVFELVNYASRELKKIEREPGELPNDIRSVIFSGGDVPLTRIR